MLICKWDKLPKEMQTETVRYYYDILKKKQLSLAFKRVFDIVVSAAMLIALLPIFLILAIAIKVDSAGPVFYRQVRVTQYGRRYRIFKFRTMIVDADKQANVTVNNDSRITRVGATIRKYRLDEICQLIDILRGNMSFVGTRPEIPRYVDCYTDEMMATLLLPAGVTSEASVYYKDESELLDGADNVDKVYIEKVLPGKMYYNLREIEKFSFLHDIKVMVMTVFAVLGKEYMGDYTVTASQVQADIHQISERESVK